MTKTPTGTSGGKNTSGRGQRELRVRVKTAKGRKLSSTLWLERQLNDPYVQRAKKEVRYPLLEVFFRHLTVQFVRCGRDEIVLEFQPSLHAPFHNRYMKFQIANHERNLFL